MKLREFFAEISGTIVTGDAEILGIANDPRKVQRGDLFFSVTGLKAASLKAVRTAVVNADEEKAGEIIASLSTTLSPP